MPIHQSQHKRTRTGNHISTSEPDNTTTCTWQTSQPLSIHPKHESVTTSPLSTLVPKRSPTPQRTEQTPAAKTHMHVTSIPGCTPSLKQQQNDPVRSLPSTTTSTLKKAVEQPHQANNKNHFSSLDELTNRSTESSRSTVVTKTRPPAPSVFDLTGARGTGTCAA